MIHIEWCFFGVFAIECLLRYLWSGYMKQARPRSLSLFVCVVVAMICHALEVWRETSGSRHFWKCFGKMVTIASWTRVVDLVASCSCFETVCGNAKFWWIWKNVFGAFCKVFESVAGVIRLVTCDWRPHRAYSFGAKWFFGIRLHRVRVFLLLLVALDLSIASAMKGHSFRFSRIFRAGFLFLHLTDIRFVICTILLVFCPFFLFESNGWNELNDIGLVVVKGGIFSFWSIASRRWSNCVCFTYVSRPFLLESVRYILHCFSPRNLLSVWIVCFFSKILSIFREFQHFPSFLAFSENFNIFKVY